MDDENANAYNVWSEVLRIGKDMTVRDLTTMIAAKSQQELQTRNAEMIQLGHKTIALGDRTRLEFVYEYLHLLEGGKWSLELWTYDFMDPLE
ncbi:hypothetical protein ABW21_db0202826 [Orbilia brochopaga]|nr:hypothetical protein ABW21_db0202826 [Drechslerella brochopaga]